MTKTYLALSAMTALLGTQVPAEAATINSASQQHEAKIFLAQEKGSGETGSSEEKDIAAAEKAYKDRNTPLDHDSSGIDNSDVDNSDSDNTNIDDSDSESDDDDSDIDS